MEIHQIVGEISRLKYSHDENSHQITGIYQIFVGQQTMCETIHFSQQNPRFFWENPMEIPHFPVRDGDARDGFVTRRLGDSAAESFL
jgi:hypothetical protein